MIEYAVGPILAVLVAMKFTDYKVKEQVKRCEEYATSKAALVAERLDQVSAKVDLIDQETLKKMLVTITPVAKAVKELQDSIGVQ